MNVKIFVSHRIDQDSEIIDNPIYVNVRCGAVYDKRKGITMLGDDTGDNISEKRLTFNELTVQYWAWKNVEADYYGLCHYRRYFSFNPQKMLEDIHGAVNYTHLSPQCIEEIFPSKENVQEQIGQADIIISTPANFRKVNFKNLYTQYDSIPDLHVQDLMTAADIVKELYPQYSTSVDGYLNGSLFYPCNMFIMKKEVFHQYCEWLFSILDKLEQKIDISNYSVEGKRCFGHIAERLLGVFYTYIKDNCPKYKTKVLQRTIIWNTEKVAELRPVFREHNVPIVFACSDFFVPYAGVSLASVLENTSPLYNYDIIFLHTNISNESQQRLFTLTQVYKNVSLRFIDVSLKIDGLKLISNNHISTETFYRLLAPEILSNYEKVVYLDSDIIVLMDIAALYSIDIGDNLLAATIDADYLGEYNGAVPHVKAYADKILKLESPHRYVQAGVLVMNIKEFNKRFSKGELVSLATKREYMYADQDVLNMCCQGRIYFLDMSWNVMTDCAGMRVKDMIKRAPSDIYEAYMEARKHPYIIHYAGFEKPWNNPRSDMSERFWEYARKTLFYEEIIYLNIKNLSLGNKKPNIKESIKKVLPPHSKIRYIAQSIYHWLKKIKKNR